ncbi:hypothetical protein C0J52_10584 [Blattella germanica]|nr:hypothetical protein C0J52_10584 [Blattella germanica]
MPDVSRSDSQRSDSSRPRVSFNRDVHVKRITLSFVSIYIGTPGAPKVVGALAGDGEGHLVPLPVRRERPNRLSRRELAKEAERVLAQADKINCTSRSLLEQSQKGNSNKTFSTLPPLRRKNKKNRHNKTNHSAAEQSPTSSPDRNTNKKHSNKRTHYTDNESIERETPPSSLDRKSAKRNFVASVFSTLDRSLSRKNKHLQEDDNSENLKKSKKNSSSLNDLLDESSLEKPRKNRPDLKRSVSDAGSRKNIKNNIKVKKSSGFLSLDRLTSKRNKNKNKTLVIHSDYSDRSPARPRKNILKKSHSDSESVPQGTSQEHSHLHGEGRKKKQLSPIIEVHPREDYFHEKKTSQQLPSSSEKIDVSDREETMIHSSQLPTQKPVLTRGQTVDAMVKRLSQDFSRSRGPPRVVTSAPGLITPEHRQHNNNLPFSYTKPTANQYGSSAPTADPTHDSPLNGGPAGNTRAPTASDGQVIYAEVVVSGGGSNGGAVSKQTVHTKVLPISQLQQEEPIQPKLHSRQLDTSKVFPSEVSSQQHKVTVKVTDHNHQGSDEDEGLGLMMDHSGYRHNSVDYMDEGKSYNRKGVINSYNGGNSYVSRGGFIEKRIRNGDEERSSFQNTTRREIRTDYGGNNIRKEYSVSESKYESDNYIIDPSARGRADGMDSRKKDFVNSESYSGGRYDDVPYHPHMNNISPTLRRNHNGDYSRNESYKSELLSDARIIPPDEIDGHGHFGRSSKDLLSRSIDSNDLSSRRDRLESRIESQRKERFVSNKFSDVGNYKKDPLDTRNEINRKYTTDATYNNRRDFLNSQLDYDKTPTIKEEIRHESDKNFGVKTSRYYESSVTEVDSYGKKDLFADSGIEVDYRTKDSYNSRKYEKPSLHDNKVSVNHHTQNVTRVDLRNHSHDRISDEDEVDLDKETVNHYSDIGQHHKTKTTNTFTSTRLVQEQKHSETIPSSTVLIRHYVPSSKEDSNSTKTKHTPSSKSKPEKIQQPLLSDEEYEEYEKSRRRDEHKKEATEEYRKNEEKVRRNEEKLKKNGDKKDIKKKPTSAMDKMRQLFTRSDTKTGKKNKRKEDREKVKVIVETVEEEDEEDDPLTARYTEYRGSNIDLRQESPRPPYRDRSYVRGSNMDTEEETPKSVLKNKRIVEPGSPRERRHVHGSSTELDQDVSHKGLTSPKSSNRNRIHHIREVDEGTPRTPHRDVSRGVHHRIPSDIDEHKVRVQPILS